MTDLAAPQHGRESGQRTADRASGRARPRDDWRLFLVIAAFVLAYSVVGVRMGAMALSEPEEPSLGGLADDVRPVRGEIIDRNGNMLAGNLPAWSLYARPRELKEPLKVAAELARVFPEIGEEKLAEQLTSKRAFVWIKRPITPRQKQQVHDLGRPGLFFGARTVRVYPAGAPVAHIVGGVKAAKEGVRYTELVGAAGAEAHFDERLRDPALAGDPLRLSLDLGAQTALREVLEQGVERFTARGAAGVLLNVRTGEILAMVSLPDYDPNLPPQRFDGPAYLSPRFNRAAQGRYELGSTFKPLTAAIALDLGLVAPDTMIKTGSPIYFGRSRIRDIHRMPPEMTLTDVIRRSSNVGAARLALMIGIERFQERLKSLGMFDPTGVELAEAAGARSLLPPKWTELSSMTISFGHGLATTPLHLAAAYATIANGGRRVLPSLVSGGRGPGPQVLRPETSRAVLGMLREVVRGGTGRRADVEGYELGGKTGTADVAKPGGGYYSDRVIATFASVFPTSDPAYVLVVTLDEPTNREGPRPIREASRTAVPLVGEAVRRIAPILGLRPRPEKGPGAGQGTAVAAATN